MSYSTKNFRSGPFPTCYFFHFSHLGLHLKMDLIFFIPQAAIWNEKKNKKIKIYHISRNLDIISPIS